MTTEQQISELERLTKLRDTGALTEEEFAAQKATILGGARSTEHVRFYRRLWVVVLLTCLILTFPIAMIILFTGEVYKRAKDGSLTPIKNKTRYVYASLLALWLVAAIINSIVNPNTWKQDLAGWSTVKSSAGTQTAGDDSNVPDKCDSSDAAEMVKGALEGENSAVVTVKVLDFGHAQETVFDKSKNVRHCQAEAVLNTGDSLVTYQLYFGPSGGELVQVEQGIRAEQQQLIDRDFEKDAAALAEANKAEAAAATAASGAQPSEYTGGKYHRTTPASSDMKIIRKGDFWHITIDGAGPANGANTPADCSLVAEGAMANGQINASVVPFENDNMEISADDLKSSPGTVVIQVTPSGANVVQATVQPYCGAGSDLTGRYSQTP